MNVSESITSVCTLPDPKIDGTWASIVATEPMKDRLVNQAILSLTLRQSLPFSTTALHGLILLHGPPGTGKTTLARGLAEEIARILRDKIRLIEVNPHNLMSDEHGQSQQRVHALLCEHIPSLADDGKFTVVLLDEVESMAVARSAASLEANPADVHRATDAVLTALDHNGRHHPHLLTVATSNFTEALDEAFRSRADLALEIPLPNRAAVEVILRQVLLDFGAAYPEHAKLAEDKAIARVAEALVGLDGRRIRKIVTEALSGRRSTVLSPGAMTVEDLEQAAMRLQSDRSVEGVLRAAA